MRKEIAAHFKTLGLRITISCNLKTVNFLHLTLRLDTGKHYPYRKPSDTPLYIHRQSNHPPTIIKTLPTPISHRPKDISSDKDVFKSATPAYNDTLRASGYMKQVTYASERIAPKGRSSGAVNERLRGTTRTII